MNKTYNLGDTVLGNWKLTRLIGQGSFGKVFEAERREFDVTFKSAIKIVSFPLQQIGDSQDDMGEAERAASLRCSIKEYTQILALIHKLSGCGNIVSQADHAIIEHTEGIGWNIMIRMELLTPLPEYLQDAALTRGEVINLGIDICKALEICQRYNMIHRDIKPNNIFVSDSGAFKLGDFGIARLGEANVLTSNLRRGFCTYMAPEMWSGEPYGGSVDIYSLGVMLYCLLNDNRPPFLPLFPAPVTMSAQEDALARRMRGEKLPPPKNADWQLVEIVRRACSYRWKDRFDSPAQMREALENAKTIRFQPTPFPSPFPPGDSSRNHMDEPTVPPFLGPAAGEIPPLTEHTLADAAPIVEASGDMPPVSDTDVSPAPTCLDEIT